MSILNGMFGFVTSKVLPFYALIFILGFWAVGFYIYYNPELDRKKLC